MEHITGWSDLLPASVGIDPDYDSHIPESKSFSVEKLVEKLNKEAYPWDKVSYSVHLRMDWEWQTDVVFPAGVILNLNKNKETIGLLQFVEGTLWSAFMIEGVQILDTATIFDVKFIRECTGWTINV